jgi:hypothetical protein
MRKKFELELSEKAKTNPKAIWSYIISKSKSKEEIGDLHLNPEDTKKKQMTTRLSLIFYQNTSQVSSLVKQRDTFQN